MRTTIRDVLPEQYRRKPSQKPSERAEPFRAGTPLVYCIQQFGGVVEFAKAIGRSTRQIYRWRNQGGLISAEGQTEAVLAAKRMGIALDVSRLVYMPPVASTETGNGAEVGDQGEVNHVDDPAGIPGDR